MQSAELQFAVTLTRITISSSPVLMKPKVVGHVTYLDCCFLQGVGRNLTDGYSVRRIHLRNEDCVCVSKTGRRSALPSSFPAGIEAPKRYRR